MPAWTGKFVCPECEEEFGFIRESEGIEGLEHTYLAIAHVHDNEHPDGQWVASVFRRKKGGHFPVGVKELQLIVKDQKAAAAERKRVQKASPKPRAVDIPTPPPVKGLYAGTRVIEGRAYQVTRLEAATQMQVPAPRR